VKIGGRIDGGRVYAGGSLEITGGAIGRDTGAVHAEGNLSVRHALGMRIQCGGRRSLHLARRLPDVPDVIGFGFVDRRETQSQKGQSRHESARPQRPSFSSGIWRDLEGQRPKERHATLRTAVGRMNENGIHGLLIAPDTPHRGYSILTAKDCIQVLSDSGEEALEELCVEDAMTQPAVTIPVDLCIADCIRLMQLAGVRTVPVLDDRELVGILSFTDILKAIDGPLDTD